MYMQYIQYMHFTPLTKVLSVKLINPILTNILAVKAVIIDYTESTLLPFLRFDFSPFLSAPTILSSTLPVVTQDLKV